MKTWEHPPISTNTNQCIHILIQFYCLASLLPFLSCLSHPLTARPSSLDTFPFLAPPPDWLSSLRLRIRSAPDFDSALSRILCGRASPLEVHRLLSLCSSVASIALAALTALMPSGLAVDQRTSTFSGANLTSPDEEEDHAGNGPGYSAPNTSITNSPGDTYQSPLLLHRILSRLSDKQLLGEIEVRHRYSYFTYIS